MTGFGNVAVAGLGLVGGSLARDLAARGVRVLGHDRDPAAVRAAVEEGVVAALGPRLEGVEEADVLVLAIPPGAAEEVLAAALPRLGRARLVTDAASTKRGIAAAAERLGVGSRFVGAHPLAGSHLSGWGASRAGLFEGAPVFVCPGAESGAGAVALAGALWRSVGGRVRLLPAEEHDRLLAWSSHLPQLVSTALAGALGDAGIARAQLGPGGRDMTRLAGSSPEMWTGITRENADFLAAALAATEARLAGLRRAVEAGDAGRIAEVFREAQGWFGEE